MLYNMHVDQIMPKLLQAFWNGSTNMFYIYEKWYLSNGLTWQMWKHGPKTPKKVELYS